MYYAFWSLVLALALGYRWYNRRYVSVRVNGKAMRALRRYGFLHVDGLAVPMDDNQYQDFLANPELQWDESSAHSR